MDEKDKIAVNAAPVIEAEKGNVNVQEHSEMVTTLNRANHNEIRIMETDLDLIRDAAESIGFGPKVDPSSIVIGALIPCAIELASAALSENVTPNFWPIVICGAVYILVNFLEKKGCIHTANSEVNKTYLAQIQKTLKRIESASQKTRGRGGQ